MSLLVAGSAPSPYRQRRPSRLLVLSGSVTVVLLASCLLPSAIWLESGSTLRALTFGLAQRQGGTKPVESLHVILLRTCYQGGTEQAVLWEARGPELTDGSAPTRIQYGVAPPSFRNVRGPEALEPEQCYEVYASGDGISSLLRFSSDSAGNLTGVEQD